jgi:hypothetical protein
MVDEGGSAPPTKLCIDESNNDSSLNVDHVENIGGKNEGKNIQPQLSINSSQISSPSPFGKGLGKKPFNFEKMAEIYDKENNVIDLVPGAGLFDLLKIFLIYFYLSKIKKKELLSTMNIILYQIFRFLLLLQIQQI